MLFISPVETTMPRTAAKKPRDAEIARAQKANKAVKAGINTTKTKTRRTKVLFSF